MMAYCPFSGLVSIVKTITYTPFHGVEPKTTAVVDPADLESNLGNPGIWTGPQSHVTSNLALTKNLSQLGRYTCDGRPEDKSANGSIAGMWEG